MGVDLTLLPFDCDHEDNAFSHTILSCDRRRDLWAQLNKLKTGGIVPKDFTTFYGRSSDGGHGYGDTQETPYGEPLTYTTVEELLKVKDDPGVLDNYKNRAIWAYLGELPKKTKVALYWH